jgi:hypothetical protein
MMLALLTAPAEDVVALAHQVLDRAPTEASRVARMADEALEQLKAEVLCERRPGPIAARAELFALRARADLTRGHDRSAFDMSYKVLFWLEQAVGSRQLERALRSASPEPVAAAALSLLEVFGASLGAVPEPARSHCREIGRGLIEAYATSRCAPAAYARAGQAAAAWRSVLQHDALASRLAVLAEPRAATAQEHPLRAIPKHHRTALVPVAV